MDWNWRQPGWPAFTWQRDRLARAEAEFVLAAGIYIGSVRHLAPADQEDLTVESLCLEAIDTSEIEGEILDRASVQSSIRRQLGLHADRRRARPAEQGIAEMTVDLYRSFAEPLSHEALFRWHRLVTSGRRDLSDIGRYRRHAEPMQIVSGPLHAPRVHFEAPASAVLEAEMAGFVAWFNRTAPDGPEPMPTLARAGIAHVRFVAIHPFEDGNGRIARALAEKAFAQSLGRPTLTVLAATILSRRKAYYDALEQTNTTLDMTEWLCWFAAASIEARRRTNALVDFLIDKARLLDRLSGQLNERQQKALLRVLREGPDGFAGGLSARNYVAITGATASTATRDLADMVAKGALTRSGERRYARYQANVRRQPVPRIEIGPGGEIRPA